LNKSSDIQAVRRIVLRIGVCHDKSPSAALAATSISKTVSIRAV
jgi:hypothetical protein